MLHAEFHRCNCNDRQSCGGCRFIPAQHGTRTTVYTPNNTTHSQGFSLLHEPSKRGTYTWSTTRFPFELPEESFRSGLGKFVFLEKFVLWLCEERIFLRHIIHSRLMCAAILKCSTSFQIFNPFLPVVELSSFKKFP